MRMKTTGTHISALPMPILFVSLFRDVISDPFVPAARLRARIADLQISLSHPDLFCFDYNLLLFKMGCI